MNNIKGICGRCACLCFSFFLNLILACEGIAQPIEILSYTISDKQPEFYNAIYTSSESNQLRSRNMVSFDNGRTWENKPTGIKRLQSPPAYGRRVPVTSIFDENKNYFVTFLNAFDNPNVPKNIAEPKEVLQGYYLRYRVSNDNGESWLFDEPIIAQGQFTSKNPFPEIVIGKNAFYLGDCGSRPIISNSGDLLLPVQATVIADSKRKSLNRNNLFNPAGGYSYTEVLILRGKWKADHLLWEVSGRLKGDPKATTRGLIEPTMIKFDNGKILTVMRGSNGGESDPQHKLPSYKWFSYSRDDGRNWSKPKPWTYDDESTFFSPSSMSFLFKHSSGRCFWVGNISAENPKIDRPRYPLVIGEVNQNSMKLIKSSIQILDTYKKRDEGKGELDLGHVTLVEDRVSKQIILVYPRIYSRHKKRDWATIKVKVNP